jgi:hypothetical protein
VPAILALRGVWARAVDPTDPLARVAAADKLVRAQLRKLVVPSIQRPDVTVAVQKLFGMAGTQGTTLTWRRSEAIKILGYDPDHFRVRVEKKVLQALAWQLAQDSLNYVPRGRSMPQAEASGDTPTITKDDLSDPSVAAHQVALSRIWSEVYALRADLITREMHRGSDEARFNEAAKQADVTLGSLLLRLDDYLDSHGETILHGESEFNARALIRLAGWSGELTDGQVRELKWRARRAGSGSGRRAWSQHEQSDDYAD